MLPKYRRITRATEFSAIVKHGVKTGSSFFVVYMRSQQRSPQPAQDILPSRVGLIVGKNTGNAVQRHALSRKLRHIMASESCFDGYDVVIRAHGQAAHVSSEALATQLRKCHAKLERKIIVVENSHG